MRWTDWNEFMICRNNKNPQKESLTFMFINVAEWIDDFQYGSKRSTTDPIFFKYFFTTDPTTFITDPRTPIFFISLLTPPHLLLTPEFRILNFTTDPTSFITDPICPPLLTPYWPPLLTPLLTPMGSVVGSVKKKTRFFSSFVEYFYLSHGKWF